MSIRQFLDYFSPGMSPFLLLFVFTSQPVMAASPGKDLFESKCAMCHELPAPKAMAGGNWPGRINEMIEFSDLSDKERSTLLKHIQSLISNQKKRL